MPFLAAMPPKQTINSECRTTSSHLTDLRLMLSNGLTICGMMTLAAPEL